MKELIEIQSKLHAPKGQTNKFGGYKYRNCEDIMKAVKPLLTEQACTLIVQDEIVEVAGRVYVKATAILEKAGGGTSRGSVAYAREPESKKGMDESQITGAASSYARKYALNGLFCIDDTPDADSAPPPEPPKKPTAPVKAEKLPKQVGKDQASTTAQHQKIAILFGELERVDHKYSDMSKIAHREIRSAKELTKAEATTLIERMQKAVDVKTHIEKVA